MGRWLTFLAAVGGVFIVGGAQSADFGQSARVGPLSLTRLAQRLPAGKEWAIYQIGVFCRTQDKLKADGVQTPISLDIYGPLFVTALSAAGFGKSDADNLFADASKRPEPSALEVGALVHDMDLKLCVNPGKDVSAVGGAGSVKVQWQIYSPAKRSVVATIETVGSATQKSMLTALDPASFPQRILKDAFADAARQLAVSSELKAVLDAAPSKDDALSSPGQQPKLSASGGSTPRSIADTVGSVVLIALANGHGSGVLISSDGYVLTNAHVVGQNRTVKVRWSDGYETDGQVLRIHPGRDVALIKTDARGRQPVPPRVGALQPGEAVMAIGAPLDEGLQGTVTRGIVSAPSRIVEGYNFIQSDVTVNPGNSGGALIDDKGYLIGLTDIGLRPDGVPSGLNFFIPIKEALDFVSLELIPAPSPPVAANPASRPGAARR